MSNIDCRGVKRGRCSCGECEEFLGSSKIECGYCSCVPAKHQKLDDVNVAATNSSNASEDIETAMSFECNVEVNAEIEQLSEESTSSVEMIDSNENNTVSTISNLPEEYKTEWVKIDDIIPHNFNAEFHIDIMSKLFKDEELEKLHFCKIVRLISEKLIDAKKTNKTYVLIAAIIATRRFPALRGKNAEAVHRRMEMRLHQCLKNKKQRGKANDKKNVREDCDENYDDDSFCTASQVLLEETEKTQNTASFKKFLSKTRKLRQKDVTSLSAAEVLQKYPVLQNTQFLLWEFGELVQMPIRTMIKNLKIGIPKVLATMTKDSNETNTDLYFLKKIDSFFPTDKKRGRNKKRKLVTLIEVENEENDEVPKTDRAPSLIIQGDCEKNVKCYVDAEPLFIETPLNAIVLLLATYWVFDIHFDQHFHNQLTLLSFITFGDNAERILGPHGIESISVNNIMLKARL